MDKQVETRINRFREWNYMEIFSWILYSFAIITFILIHQNVFEGIALLEVPLNGNSVNFGIPTLIFMIGYFIHIWSIYIEKHAENNSMVNIFQRALGTSIIVTIVAFIVLVVITIIEG